MQRSPSEAADGADGGSDAGQVKRACDQCRIRKIRCDKESPCANCRIAQRSCNSTGLGQKPREPRQRVLISTQYEKKIDYFGTRLAGIEELLRELTVSLKNSQPSATSSTSGTVSSVPHTSVQRDASYVAHSRVTPSSATANTVFDEGDDSDASSDLGDTGFEGGSSIAAHTVQASEFVEHVVQRERWNSQQLSPNMQSALASLQQMVGMHRQRKTCRMAGSLSRSEIRFDNQKPLPPGGLKELPMPPSQTVLSILRNIKEKPPITFTMFFAYITVKEFTEACRRVYFPTEDFSVSTFIVVTAGLFYLFQELHIMMDENSGTATEYLAYHHMCRDNLETALANLPFFMPPKMETIEALLLGISYMIEISKPSLAWQLNCMACNLCTSLGYHRSPAHQTSGGQAPSQGPLPVDPLSQKKQTLFWFAYMLDKGLSLRFGRASVLQDYDIALPRSALHTGDGTGNPGGPSASSDPLNDALELWIRHAEIQGQAYEYLYSSAALQRSIASRVQSAQLLVDKLKDIIARTTRCTSTIINAESQNHDGGNNGVQGVGAGTLMAINMVLKSDEISLYSTLALIYRAIPPAEPGRPTTFNDECIAAARAAFRLHQECMEMTASSQFMNAAYLHWTILYAPFVPFIVIFCHVIETSDKDDLRRLEEFVNSLQTSRAASRAIDKMHRLCRIMCDVAALYVESKDAEKQRMDMNMTPIGNDFNLYLAQLGLMAPLQASFNAGDDVAEGEVDSEMLNASYQATQLGEWFEGGRHMMGLLEEDLSQFQPEPGVWSVAHGGPP